MRGHALTYELTLMQMGMDGASFAKLCRDSGLLGGKLNTTAVDIAFSKAKAKVMRFTSLLHARHEPVLTQLH